ncbi:MAG TPA: helix-turn-helix domain-containing protein [Gammaproteobacteria bacterium]|nr:helix-turn-helix domain-containing protein [Gammaproteobacteria bacterium]
MLSFPTVPPSAEEAVRARYESAADAETRTRYQMVLLAQQGLSATAIAPLVVRSHDTVSRVLRRYRAGGLDAVPHRPRPGRAPTITPVWQAELVRVIDLDPHDVGVPSANWTTGLLANYLAQQTGIAVDQETVRRYLHRLGYVCKRPTWTVAHKAHEREDYLGNACGRSSC